MTILVFLRRLSTICEINEKALDVWILSKNEVRFSKPQPGRHENEEDEGLIGDAVAWNLAPPPEERHPASDVMLLALSEFRRRRCGTPPRRRADCGLQWHLFLYFRTRQGQPIGFNLTYGQMPAPLIGVSP